MKTTMQELIDLMKSHKARGWGNMTFDFFFAQLDEIKALEKEKEQIMKAYKDHHDLEHIFGLDTEQYFNQTYNKPIL
jgi:hypothetical protein